jgi:hypothetical protein
LEASLRAEFVELLRAVKQELRTELRTQLQEDLAGFEERIADVNERALRGDQALDGRMAELWEVIEKMGEKLGDQYTQLEALRSERWDVARDRVDNLQKTVSVFHKRLDKLDTWMGRCLGLIDAIEEARRHLGAADKAYWDHKAYWDNNPIKEQRERNAADEVLERALRAEDSTREEGEEDGRKEEPS